MRISPVPLVVSAVMAAVLLAGCSPTPDSPPEPLAVSEEPAVQEESCDFWEGPGDYLISCAMTAESFSDFDQISFKGMEEKETFDRRVNEFVTNTSLVYTATFLCSPDPVDVVVNSEFAEGEAEEQALRFARVMGQMPFASRAGVREIWIHGGNESAGGGNSAVSFHTEYADEIGGWIEEVFLHEAAHTSLDYAFDGSIDEALWAKAVSQDGKFISQYAADNPDREDIAESHVAFIIRELSRSNDRLLDSAAKIEALIPARLAYFESLGEDFRPISENCG